MRTLKSAPIKIKILLVVIAVVTITGPVLLALYLAGAASQDAEMDKVLGYARDVQNRGDITTDQIMAGTALLVEHEAGDPCSPSHLALMRQIDLSSSYIQAVGHIEGTRLVCASIGDGTEHWDLGPVDFTSRTGAKLRLNATFPFVPDTKFAVVEKQGYATIINKRLPIDATTNEKDVSLATFSLDTFNVYASRGLIKQEWLARLGDKPYVRFTDGGYVVGIVRSPRHPTAAVAALPATYIDRKTGELALLLLPVGFLGGLMLAFAMFYLVRNQISTQGLLKSGLARNELFMHYQPVIDLQTGKYMGAEALIRWERPNGEMMRPDIFIPIAEESGMMQQVTKRVSRLIARDAHNFFAAHPDFHLAINLSAADFHSEEILAVLHELIEATGARSKNLIVEATEHCLIDMASARSMISKIRAHGVEIALDDFGTGYSSLSYLDSFHIDYLKIDKSFVDKIGTEAPTSNVIGHIIELAKSMNMKMIAEGVETEAQADYLRRKGVHYAQGALFGHPMPFEEFVSVAMAKHKISEVTQSA
jgi:sensor c-di-GMP phosphodiesterase-like protein